MEPITITLAMGAGAAMGQAAKGFFDLLGVKRRAESFEVNKEKDTRVKMAELSNTHVVELGNQLICLQKLVYECQVTISKLQADLQVKNVQNDNLQNQVDEMQLVLQSKSSRIDELERYVREKESNA